MPSIPPPPPPAINDLDNIDNPSLNELTLEEAAAELNIDDVNENEEPFGIALYDFPGTQDDDLPFKVRNITNSNFFIFSLLNKSFNYIF